MGYETNKKKILKIQTAASANGNKTDALLRHDINDKNAQVFNVLRPIRLIQGYNFTYDVISTPFDARVTVISKGAGAAPAG